MAQGKSGFTLIELLTVVVIMTTIFSIVAFSIGGARGSARDERRKADLAAISSGLEKYKSDCGTYPTASTFQGVLEGASLLGNGSTPSCLSGNVYIREMPYDPESPSKSYSYNPDASRNNYTLCAALESAPVPAMSAGCIGASSCGSSCNYIVVNP